jgi:hypothetical protein
MRLRSVLVVLLLLAACGGDDDERPQVAPETTTTTAPADELVFHVEPDGLLANDDRFVFGTTEGGYAVDLVRDVLGMEVEEGDQPDCPAGPATFARFDDHEGSLLLTMQGDVLVGWSLSEGSTLTTAADIGVGSTKAEVESAYGPVEVLADSTLGIELFVEGGISALLTADAPDGTVTALWAGVNCIFR